MSHWRVSTPPSTPPMHMHAGLRTWFSLVAIPAEMQGQLLVLGGLAYLAAGTIERMARALFPAPLVPEKGGLHRSRTPVGPRKKQQ